MNMIPKSTFLIRNGQGFTLVELMITLVVATILITMGVPSMSTMIKNNRLTAHTNQFVTAMNFARSEAIKRGATISVTAVDATDNANEWGPGWQVLNGVEVLRVFPALEASTTFNSANGVSTFGYLASGRVGNADTLTLCDDRTAETGRVIDIALTGRVSTTTAACA